MADKLFLCVCYKQVLEFLNFLKMKQVSPKIKWRHAPPKLHKCTLYYQLKQLSLLFTWYLPVKLHDKTESK